MKRILLVDLLSWTGHHKPYFLLYTKLFLELGYSVDVLCLGKEDVEDSFPEAISTKRLRIREPQLLFGQKIFLQALKMLHKLKGFPSASVVQPVSRWWIIKNSAVDQSLQNEAFVFLLNVREYLVDIPSIMQDHLLPEAWAGLYVCPPIAYDLQRKYCSCSLFEHSSFKGLCFLNESLVAEMKQGLNDALLHFFPDVSYLHCEPNEPPIVLEALQKAKGRKIVLLASLTKKHGLIHFLRLVDNMYSEPVFFCAMGLVRLDGYNSDEVAYIQKRLTSPPQNFLVFQNIYPPEETLNSIYRAADAAFVCYQDFRHSSNKLTKAIGLGTPVIVAKETLLSNRVQKYRLGCVIDPDDVEISSNALRSMLFNFSFDEKLRKAFIDLHSEQTLKAKLAELAQQVV